MHALSPSAAPKTAFVLAGGGSMGAVQVGMLRALLEAGIQPDLVVGSSIGAINAAYFAGNPSLAGIAKLERLWRGLKRSDVLPLSWRGILGFLLRREYLVPSDGLRRFLDISLPYRDLEDARVPVHIVATDLLSGEAVVLSRGPATQAILASSAIPAAFAPVEIDGRFLSDGAIASNTPVRTAIDLGARRLIVLPTSYSYAPERPPSGGVESVLHTVTLLTSRQLAAELERIEQPTQCHILPTASSTNVSPFDFSRTAKLIEEGYSRTLTWLSEGGLERITMPAAPRALPSLARSPRPRSWGRDSLRPSGRNASLLARRPAWPGKPIAETVSP